MNRHQFKASDTALILVSFSFLLRYIVQSYFQYQNLTLLDQVKHPLEQAFWICIVALSFFGASWLLMDAVEVWTQNLAPLSGARRHSV